MKYLKKKKRKKVKKISHNLKDLKKKKKKIKKNIFLPSYFGNLGRLVFRQSSPVQPVSESREWSPVRDGGRRRRSQEILIFFSVFLFV